MYVCMYVGYLLAIAKCCINGRVCVLRFNTGVRYDQFATTLRRFLKCLRKQTSLRQLLDLVVGPQVLCYYQQHAVHSTLFLCLPPDLFVRTVYFSITPSTGSVFILFFNVCVFGLKPSLCCRERVVLLYICW